MPKIRYSANANLVLLAIVSDPQPPLSPSSALIQTLRQEIDRLLAASFSPWRYYAQWQEQRQLLQRLRDVLLLWPEPVTAAPVLTPDSTQALVVNALQTDIQQLLQTRQALQHEVAQLTAQRTQQQAQIMAPLITQVEQLELFQTRTNNILQDVDRTLQLTLRTVDYDIAAYEQSLAQRLAKLDDLSQQSETIVATLFQQLLQEIQQLRLSSPGSVISADAVAPPSLAVPIVPPPIDAAPVAALTPATPIAKLTDILPRLGIAPTSAGWTAALGGMDVASASVEQAVPLLDSPEPDAYLLEIDDL